MVSFEKYINKLNPECEAFFQRPVQTKPDDEYLPWYTRSPLGINKLNSMMSTISKKAKLSKTYTNHCVRATCITLLDESGFESRHIMGISKHKSESSIKHYSSRLSEERRVQASDILLKACNAENKENQPSVIPTAPSSAIEPINRTDVDNDPDIIDFLSPSQEDFLLALSVPDNVQACLPVEPMASSHYPSRAASLTPRSHQQPSPVVANRVSRVNDSNLNLYAPSQNSVAPFNLINYGNVYINTK